MQSPSKELREVALQIFERLGTPVALACALRLKYERWVDIAEKRVSPLDYVCSDTYHRDVSAVDLLRKLKLPTGIDTRAVAMNKWLAAERQCARTNANLRSLLIRMEYPLMEDLNDPYHQAQVRVLTCVRKWVGILVGRVPSLSGRPSKRSTYSLRGRDSVLINKFSTLPERTSRCEPAKCGFIHTAWYRFITGTSPLSTSPIKPGEELKIVRGNRWASVPKDGTTDRSIACEPTLNVYAQLGVGDGLKLRLRKHGLLATKATCGFESQVWHKLMAQQASKFGHLATVDLSSASDTIARSLVSAVFPADWVDLFESYRSPVTEVGSETYRLEKISSMGNGFTFELETALFAGCAAAAMELSGECPAFPYNVSVYGDDIILPTSAFNMLRLVLTFLGFSLNPGKTFSTGSFRESCGGDYFSGRDVRPIHIESDPQGPLEWYGLYNKVWRLRDLIPVGKTLGYIRSQLPSDLRKNFGPEVLGDSVLHELDDRSWNIRVSKTDNCRLPSGHREIQVLLPVYPTVDRDRYDPETVAVASLFGCVSQRIPIPNKDGGSTVPIVGYRREWVALDGVHST